MKIIVRWKDGSPPAEIGGVEKVAFRYDLLRVWSQDHSTIRDIYLETVQSITYTDLTEEEFKAVDLPK